MNADTHQHSTTSGQESATGKRQEGETPPFKMGKEGRLTARELSRRRRQRLLELRQHQAKQPASQSAVCVPAPSLPNKKGAAPSYAHSSAITATNRAEKDWYDSPHQEIQA